jgi:hypothetical protein
MRTSVFVGVAARDLVADGLFFRNLTGGPAGRALRGGWALWPNESGDAHRKVGGETQEARSHQTHK